MTDRLLAERERLEREHGPLSQKLWNLLTPILETEAHQLDPHQLFALAVAAWNMPFLEFSLREQLVHEAGDDETFLLLEMYLRRIGAFGDDPRMILDHELLELEPGHYRPILVWVAGEFAALRR